MTSQISRLFCKITQGLPRKDRLQLSNTLWMPRTGLGDARYSAAANLRTSKETSESSGSHRNPANIQPATAETTSKPLANIPFVKNLFLGEFDAKALVFPNVLSKEEIEEINAMIQPIHKYFKTGIDFAAIDEQAHIPDDVMQQLKNFGLFGLQIPTEYGGLGFSATQFARMNEVTILDPGIYTTLTAHQGIGLKGITLLGNEQQKSKYLPRLATGEHVAAFCLTEAGSGSDAASIQTRATLLEDGKTFLLNGEKLWISNGGIAQIFTVFAKTKVALPDGESKDKVTAFIVERAFGGVTSGKPEKKLGIRCSNTATVHFENTPVPIENVIGEVGGGFKVAMHILNSGRFSVGSASAAWIRDALEPATAHALQRKQFGKPLKDFGLIKEKFARIAMNVYASESMSYVTAGILDSYQTPDASVEAAAVKVFSSEVVWRATSELLQIIGGQGYMKNLLYERGVRDSRITIIFEGTNEILRLFIALNGLQHAGLKLKDVVKKLRDPLNNLGFVWKTAVDRIQTKRKTPSLCIGLRSHVHPDLSKSADALEFRVIKFRYAVEKCLSTYADKVVNEQLILKRLADITIDLFAITSCLARASKSVGLESQDHEVLMAKTFTSLTCKRIDEMLGELDEGKSRNRDDDIVKIAEMMFNSGGYALEHPLTRN